MRYLIPIITLVLSEVWAGAFCFRISSFNVQVFGQKKAAKPEVMSTLSQVIQRYDIIQIQEIRDKKGKAIKSLLQQTNDLGPATYDLVISDRLGRTRNKEQNAFLFRKGVGIEVTGRYHYQDTNDEFERPPFAIRISSLHTGIKDFVLVGVHVDPDTAVQEINSLVFVHGQIQEYWDTDNILIMGDFNADCGYVGEKALNELGLRNESFTWLIDDDVDTTTKATDCAYDRFVMTGEEFMNNVIPRSAQTFDFRQAMDLSYEETIAVSDHFPIELALKSTEQRDREDL